MCDPAQLITTAAPALALRTHGEAIRGAIERVLASGVYILGPEVEAFEREFSAYLGGGSTIGVANGTEALELALRAVGVRAGDCVATVANTVSATVAAIEQIGAHPVFIDIDPATMTLSATALDAVLSEATARMRAVVPVHLYGQPADLPGICALAERYNVSVVEDCAQAHGASIAGRRVGTWGNAAAFSFYPTKNLGAFGDGGAVFSRSPEVAERVRQLRQYGWSSRYISATPGRNSRLDEIQAAILRVRLPDLDSENAKRSILAEQYLKQAASSSLLNSRITWPTKSTASCPVWHQFAVRLPNRDHLRRHLETKQIQCGVLYPVPIHQQPAYRQAVELPVTERACQEVLCLPCHPWLSSADITRVLREIEAWLEG